MDENPINRDETTAPDPPARPYEPPVAEAIEGPDPDSVAAGSVSPLPPGLVE
ncbi:MAG: hypothetical protein QOF65_334 [Thermoleophilaceae bacterium]|jgi:hypothetical protein|nr:hypothetical protein [Thermoleophilaceae bacterium]MEA2435778.1 hypothetical protein [Thermoleophilaceae bacterium]